MKLWIISIFVIAVDCPSFGQEIISNFKNEPVASILYCDSALLSKYKTLMPKDTLSRNEKLEGKIIREVLTVINKFNGRRLDTIIKASMNFNGKSKSSKFISRVYLFSDTIYVDTWLVYEHDTIWRDRLKNPYFGAFDSPESGLDNLGSFWTKFTVGVYYGPPTLVKYPKYRDDTSQLTLHQGLNITNAKGVLLNMDQWKTYLKDFKGDLFMCGHPIIRNELLMWYEPLKCFVTYFAS